MISRRRAQIYKQTVGHACSLGNGEETCSNAGMDGSVVGARVGTSALESSPITEEETPNVHKALCRQ